MKVALPLPSGEGEGQRDAETTVDSSTKQWSIGYRHASRKGDDLILVIAKPRRPHHSRFVNAIAFC